MEDTNEGVSNTVSPVDVSQELLEICKRTLVASNYNWFELQEIIESELRCGCDTMLLQLFSDLSVLGFTKSQEDLIVQSKQAFDAAENYTFDAERSAQALNGCVVSESESDPQHYTALSDPLSEAGRLLISKRRMHSKTNKTAASKIFLSRRVLKRTSKILTDCKDIGKLIEKFVSDNNVGADAWRRTGVLTFDGNTRLGNKVTYERIRQHLQDVYKRHFSYGTVVQLCSSEQTPSFFSLSWCGASIYSACP